MTDNTQELSEIIREMRYRVLEDNGLTVNGLTTIEQESMQAIIDWHTRNLNEAIREEWALISEVAHSANITAELFIGKAREDRLAELDTINAGDERRKHTINAGQPDENTRLTPEPDRTLKQIVKETCEWEQTCQID